MFLYISKHYAIMQNMYYFINIIYIRSYFSIDKCNIISVIIFTAYITIPCYLKNKIK